MLNIFCLRSQLPFTLMTFHIVKPCIFHPFPHKFLIGVSYKSFLKSYCILTSNSIELAGQISILSALLLDSKCEWQSHGVSGWTKTDCLLYFASLSRGDTHVLSISKAKYRWLRTSTCRHFTAPLLHFWRWIFVSGIGLNIVANQWKTITVFHNRAARNGSFPLAWTSLTFITCVSESVPTLRLLL